MTSRFGRNKRRQAQATINSLAARNLELVKEILEAERNLKIAEHKARDSISQALNSILNEKENLKEATRFVAAQLGRAYGMEAQQAIEQLWSYERPKQNLPWMNLSGRISEDEKSIIVTGRIRELRYNFAFRRGF